MKAPSSPYFTAIDLSSTFNADRDTLPDSLRLRAPAEWAFGPQTLRGMPFALGRPNTANVICLDQAPVTVPLGDVMASYLVFVSLVFVVINLAVDIFYYLVDPRLRHGG